MNCILCGGEGASLFYTEPKAQTSYYRCGNCDLRFLDPARHLPPAAEKSRYDHHQNDPSDPRYQRFLEPLTDLIEEGGPGQSVLDFGSGEGGVIRHVLEPRGYKVTLFDPFFHPEASVLKRTYDFVAASEVAEHLYDPAKEFALLRGLLRPGGRLGIMTELCSEETDFATWYYRRDPTHVAFYSRETLQWIRGKYAFKDLRIHSSRLAEYLT